MLDRFSAYDKAIIGGAVTMAASTLFPLIRLPIVGSMNYFANGQGNGVLIIILAGAVVAATLAEYRRVSGALGIVAMMIIAYSFTGLLGVLSKARSAPTMKSDIFSGLSDLIMSSIGFEWGWIPLFGGALTLTLAAFMSSSSTGFTFVGSSQDSEPASPAINVEAVDDRIATYLKLQKTVAKPMTGFGKRGL